MANHTKMEVPLVIEKKLAMKGKCATCSDWPSPSRIVWPFSLYLYTLYVMIVTNHSFYIISFYSNKICGTHLCWPNCCPPSCHTNSTVWRASQTVTFHKLWLQNRPSKMTTSISSIAKARYEFEISITNFESCKSAVEASRPCNQNKKGDIDCITQSLWDCSEGP